MSTSIVRDFSASRIHSADYAPCGLLTLDSHWRVLSMNAHMDRLFGRNRGSDPLPANLRDMLTVAGRILLDTHVGPLLLGQGCIYEITLDLLRADATRMPVILNAELDPSEPGLFQVAIFRLSHRRQFEEETLRARRQAEAAVRESQLANRVRDEFLANVSHELRTPLAGIIGMLDLVQRSAIVQEQRVHISTARESAVVLTSIIDDLIDVSKLGTGNVRLTMSALSLRDVLLSVLDLLSVKAEAKGLVLRADVQPDVPKVIMGDPTRLRQVLWNLVGNAIKFTQEGSVLVRISTQHQKSLPVLKIEVIDSGIGLSTFAQSRLFQRFGPADASISRKFGGLGLGLSISKELVHLMGGDIGVQSEPDRGSVFWFTVPATPAQAGSSSELDSPRATPLEPDAADFRPLRVLLAEDHVVMQKIVELFVTAAGHSLEVAKDGREALVAVSHRSFDVILMDIQMPEMDGVEATRAIRRLPAPIGAIPIIALTANTSQRNAEDCITVGMDGMLAKPISPDELIGALSRLQAHLANPDQGWLPPGR